MKQVGILLFCMILSACADRTTNYEELALFQDHTVPDLKKKLGNISKVLVILPHADDEIAAAGLILYLKEKGAITNLLTLCDHGEPRESELKCSVEKIGFEKFENAGFINNKWQDIIANKIVFWRENKDSIKNVIQRKINDYKPDALITYDSKMGATGHPEHLISAQIVESIFKETNNNINHKSKYLFQITLPKKLEQFLVANTKMYKLTKELNKENGLPEPNVSLDIKKYWPIKNTAGHCHQSQIGILRKVHLVYEQENWIDHINTFPKEYYKKLEN